MARRVRRAPSANRGGSRGSSALRSQPSTGPSRSYESSSSTNRRGETIGASSSGTLAALRNAASRACGDGLRSRPSSRSSVAPAASWPKTSSRLVLPMPPGPYTNNTANGGSGASNAAPNSSISPARPTKRSRRRVASNSPSEPAGRESPDAVVSLRRQRRPGPAATPCSAQKRRRGFFPACFADGTADRCSFPDEAPPGAPTCGAGEARYPSDQARAPLAAEPAPVVYWARGPLLRPTPVSVRTVACPEVARWRPGDSYGVAPLHDRIPRSRKERGPGTPGRWMPPPLPMSPRGHAGPAEPVVLRWTV